MNLANGPSWAGDLDLKAAYVGCMAYLRANSVKVIGYVHTKLGYPNIYDWRPWSEVQADIDTWNSEFGGIDGIFFDETSSLWLGDYETEQQVIDYYRGATAYVKSINPDWISVLNPGGPYSYKLTIDNPNVIGVLYE